MTWTLTIEARDAANQPVTLRYSQGRYDDPDNHFYDPRILQPGLYEAGLYAGQVLNQSRSGFGETTLINADGALDYLADYAVDGREMVLALDGVPQVVGTVARMAFSDDEVSVVLRDPLEPLMTPHPMEVYAGNNVLPEGLEGTEEDIAGEIKPQVRGEVRNATPVLVNTAKLIYQVSSLPDCEIKAVYDKGAALTSGGAYTSLAQLQSAAPSAGEYRAYQGYIRVGAAPTGAVTVDAEQSAPLAGAVAGQLAADRGWTLNSSDAAALDALGRVRIYLTDETDTLSLLDRIAESIGGYLSVGATGVLRIQPLEAPATPALTLHDYEIETISRSATGAGDNGLPVWRVTVEADRIETVQDDLAGNVDDARRARLSKQTRRARADDAAVRERHPLAGELTIDSVLASSSKAQSVATRLLNLLNVRRDSVTAEAQSVVASGFSVGASVSVVTPRLGYSTGRDMLITGYRLDAETGELNLNLWG